MPPRLLHSIPLLLIGGLLPLPIAAQTPSLPPPQDVAPPPVTPLPPGPEVPPQLPPPSDLLEPVPSGTPVEPPDGDVPSTITVKQFNITGSTVFSQEELAQVVEPFVGRPITLAELFQARTAVTDYYVSKGYITSGAFIPPQRLQDGVVEIRVVEGTLEEIQITGTQRLRPGYIRSRLAIATPAPLNRDRLLEALQLLQLDPVIETVSAELAAGTRPGTSVLNVRVVEADTFGVQVLLDNARTPSVGTDRRQIQLNQGNLLGFADTLSLSYTNTDGSDAVDLSYTLPVSPRNATVNVALSVTESEVIEEPFDVLNIESRSRTFEITYRQPLVQTVREEFAVGLTATRRESDVTFNLPGFGELPFPSPGADEGETRVTALRFFQEWVRRGNREVIAARSQFTLGLDWFGATVNDDPPDSRFLAWRGQGQWVRLLAPDTLLLVRTDVQLSGETLLPLEQFGLGGLQSVRGYRQDALLTDSGIFASAEVRIPVVRIPQWEALLQVVPFFDLGRAWNSGDSEEPDVNDLASIGLGLRLQMSNTLTARFEWGIPLTDIESRDETLQEEGFYFSILYTPF